MTRDSVVEEYVYPALASCHQARKMHQTQRTTRPPTADVGPDAFAPGDSLWFWMREGEVMRGIRLRVQTVNTNHLIAYEHAAHPVSVSYDRIRTAPAVGHCTLEAES